MTTRIIALAVVVALGTAAPALAQRTPGVTDAEVTIGLTTPLSGPAAAWGSTAIAMEAWARHVNGQGGVHGRKLKVSVKDDGYVPGRAVANLTEMKDNVLMNVGLLGSAILNAAKEFPHENKFPVINPYGNPAIWAKLPRERLRYVFVNYPDYLDEGEFLVTQASALGSRKVAVFYQNDDYGKGGLDGVRRGAKTLAGKATVVGEVPYELSDRELGTHALKLKDSGADTVVIYSTATHGAIVVKEMAKAGFRPKIFASFPLGDYRTMYRLLADLWEGAHFNVIGAVLGEPDADRIAGIVTKAEPRLVGKENFALAGTTAMIIAVEGLRRAGRNLTRETLVEGMEGIKGFTAERLTPPITFGPNRRHGLNAVRMMRAESAAQNTVAPVTGYQIFNPHF